MERKTRLNTVSSQLNTYHTTGEFVSQRTLKIRTCDMDWILEEEECENLPSRALDIFISKQKFVAVIAICYRSLVLESGIADIEGNRTSGTTKCLLRHH